MKFKSIPDMTTQSQARSKLRISDQDALLKWCRSNGYSLCQRDLETALTFDITRRETFEKPARTADFTLAVSDHDFSAQDASGILIAQGPELRGVLKRISAHLSGGVSAAG
jgi:hypothetical protein